MNFNISELNFSAFSRLGKCAAFGITDKSEFLIFACIDFECSAGINLSSSPVTINTGIFIFSSDSVVSVLAERVSSAAAMHRSIPKQIEYWARLGKVVEDNPELPLQFIQDTLLGLEEAKAGQTSDYKFGV